MNHYPSQTNHQHGPRVLSNASNANLFTTSACMSDSQHTHTHHTHTYRHTHTVHMPHKHTHNTRTRRPIHNTLPHTHNTSVKTGTNIDCRHIDHLALHKVQAMELAKSMKTHYSHFFLCSAQRWLQSNMTAVCSCLFEILTTLSFGALRKESHAISYVS